VLAPDKDLPLSHPISSILVTTDSGIFFSNGGSGASALGSYDNLPRSDPPVRQLLKIPGSFVPAPIPPDISLLLSSFFGLRGYSGFFSDLL